MANSKIMRYPIKSDATTQTAGATEPTTDVSKLQAAIDTMDCLAQEGFSEIAAIAKLALAALEHPDGYRHPENIAQALRAIWGKAENIVDIIGTEAEKVGCDYTDPAAGRRYAARMAYDQECTASKLANERSAA